MSLPPFVRRCRRWGFYALVRTLAGGLVRLPTPVGRRILRGLATVARGTHRTERRIAREQIARALPALSPRRREELARRSLCRLGDNLLDMLRADATVTCADADRARLAGLLRERPVLALMAHAGAWELVGPWMVEATQRFGAVTADPHNRRLGAWLRSRRESRGVRCFDRDRDVAAAARWLARGGCLAVLADHRPSGAQVLADWFGEPVPTPTGPARLARIASAAILPVGIRREGRGHRLWLGDEFIPAGDPREDAKRCNEALEELILGSPEEWTWFHDRYDSS